MRMASSSTKDGGTLSRTVDVKVTDPDSAKISLTYNFSSLMIGWKETDPGFASLTFDKTNDLNAYYDNSAGHLGHHSDNQWFKGAQTDSTGAQRGLQLAYPNVWYAATIRVPVSGKYIASVDYAKYKTSTGYLGVYLLKKDENLTREQIERSLTDETLLKTVYEVDSSATAVTWQEEPAELGILDLDAGEYYVVFKQQGGNSYAWFGDFHLDGLGSETAPIITDCTSEKTAFKINETAAIETAVRYITDGSSAEGVVYTYKSSDPAVAEVNADGVITAKSAGNATITITATAENATLAGTREIDITVEADKPATVSDKVSFIATANIDTDISVTGISYNGGIASVLRGEKIAIEAPEVDGYTFVGWKRGSNEKGRFINQPESFEMTLLTNTYLTAVYSEKPEADEKSVEYYNENGDYIATGAATESAPSVPTLAGYVFSGKWFVSEDSELDMSKLSDGITRAVAKHNAKDVAGNITLDGESLGAKGFNDEISLTATKSGFTSWKRDGKTVSYDRNYTYYAWSATAIEESTEEIPEGMKLPIVVLDKNTVDGAVMIEYDAGDYEIVEAGIVFGANATVESCDKKFTSQRNASHGQFAATADGAARGYVIYRDGGDYRVIYSD